MLSYLMEVLILFGCWSIVFFVIKSKSLKMKMLWSSIIIMPIGLSEYFFVPEYWQPHVIWSFHRLDIESIIFCFSVGGLAAIFYELIFNKTLRKEVRKRRYQNWALIVLMFVVGFCSSLFFDINFMYDSFIALLAGIIYIVFTRGDLKKEMAGGGFIFLLFYIVFFGVMVCLDKNYTNQWTLQNLSNIFFLGIPIEELIWAFLFGAVWAVIFEEINNYKPVSLGNNGKVSL